MTLLTICQNVLAEVGWPVLTSIATNPDGTAKQIFAIARTELRELSKSLNWPQLEVEYNFATVNGQAVYLWPDDFRTLAPQAIFNKDEYYSLKGSTGLPFWQLNKYGKLSPLYRDRFRVVYPLGQPGVEITPVPNSVEQLVAVYYSKYYARNAAGLSTVTYASDDDVSKAPEDIIELGIKWRFRRAKGLDFSVELAEYNSVIATQFAKIIASGDIPVGGRRWGDDVGITSGYVADYGFGP